MSMSLNVRQMYDKYRAFARANEKHGDDEVALFQWEYKQVPAPSEDASCAQVELELNALGRAGWELAGTLQQGRTRPTLVFKRPRSR
jgi:hypothetical protein